MAIIFSKEKEMLAGMEKVGEIIKLENYKYIGNVYNTLGDITWYVEYSPAEYITAKPVCIPIRTLTRLERIIQGDE